MVSYLAIGVVGVSLGHNRQSLLIVAYGLGIEIFYIGASVWSLVLLNRPRIVREFEEKLAFPLSEKEAKPRNLA